MSNSIVTIYIFMINVYLRGKKKTERKMHKWPSDNSLVCNSQMYCV